MRILVSNEVTNAQRNFVLPPGKNPVKIGSGAACDVHLPAGTIPDLIATIDNPGDGRSWQLRTRCDRLVHGKSPLAVNAAISLEQESVFYVYPYWITVYLERTDEIDAFQSEQQQLSRKYTQLVTVVHRTVMQHLQSVSRPSSNDKGQEAARHEESEAFVLELENTIEYEALRNHDLPVDDLACTPLGDYLAAISCRARVLQASISRFNLAARAASRPRRFWSMLRSLRPDLEQLADRLVGSVTKSLKLEESRDLTQFVRSLDSDFAPYWRQIVDRIPKELRRYLALSKLKKEIKDNWYGFGPLEDLLDDPHVTEIMVNDAETIFIEKGGVIEYSGRRFLNDLRHVIDRIVAQVHRKIDTSTPLVDARLPDGSRVNAIIAPLTVGGPVLTVRRFPAVPISWIDLLDSGALTMSACEFLKAAVAIRTNMIVSGGTSSGKTTLLNALSEFIDQRERVITIEDTAELQLRNPHVVRLETKPKNIEGVGEINIRMLLKNALRMRPDRIVVGECRGGEALDMLQAMNTGHDGSMTTIHANHPQDVISRLEVMVQQGESSHLPVEAIHRQITSAVDLIVQLSTNWVRDPETGELRRKRIIFEISEVSGIDPETKSVIIRPIFHRGKRGSLRPTGRLPSFIDRMIVRGFDVSHLKNLS